MPTTAYTRGACISVRAKRFAGAGRGLYFLVIHLALLFSVTFSADSQVINIWSGNDGVNRWSKKKNWVGDLAPVASATTTLIFRGNVDALNENDFAEGSDFGSIVFFGTTVPFTIFGSGIDLFVGMQNLDVGITQTVNLSSIRLAAPTITFLTAGDLVVNSVLTGAGALVKQGSAALFLTGSNSYTGGTRIEAGTIEIARPQSLGTGTLTLAGGSLRVNYVAPTPAVLLQNIVVLADSRIEVVQGRTVLAGSISGNASLAAIGNGTLQATVDSAVFHGVFDTQAALLLLKGTGVVPVRAQDGEADLEGSVGDVEVSGNATVDVMEGVMTGRLTTRNLTMSGGTLKLEIGGTSAGAASGGYDQFAVTGGVNLAGALNLAVLSGFAPTVGARFFLVNNDGTDPITGTFQNAPNGGILNVGSYAFMVSYQGDYATGALVGGNDLLLVATPQVPEAGSKMLGALGVLMWWGEARHGSRWRGARLRNSAFPRRGPGVDRT